MDNTERAIVALTAPTRFEDSVAKAAKAVKVGTPAAPKGSGEIVRLRRRQERATITRRKILAAATSEFSSRGFEGATTRSIAASAKVPHALVVYHFETKQGVWEAVVESALYDFHEELSKRMKQMEGHDDLTILRETMRTFIRVSAKRPELNWLVDHEAGGGSDRLHWLVDKVLRRDIDISIDLIRKAQRAGRFVAGDPAHLHFLWLGAASRIFSVAPVVEQTVGKSPFDSEFLEQHIKLCERLFFRDPPKSK